MPFVRQKHFSAHHYILLVANCRYCLHFKGWKTPNPHGTAYEATINAWPALKSLLPLADADADGIPDDWEKKHHLNPADKRDAVLFTLQKGYSNIEVYLNELVYK